MKLKAIIILLFASLLLTGCGTLKFLTPKIVAPKGSSVKSSDYEYEYYKNKNEGIVWKNVKKSKNRIEPKKSLGQRIGTWFASLATISIILLVVGMFLAPTVTISFLFWTIKRIRNALVSTVRAIKDAQADQDSKLHNSLNKYHTKDTKKIVGEIKSKY